MFKARNATERNASSISCMTLARGFVALASYGEWWVGTERIRAAWAIGVTLVGHGAELTEKIAEVTEKCR